MLYPQANPHRQVLNLDGFWQFKTDPDNTGEASRWFDGLTDTLELAVPASWNEQRLDLFHYFGKGWYEARVYIPAEWADRSRWLRVGAASMNARVWVNGKFAGEHIGPHLPFEFDVTDLAPAGTQARVTVCVDNTLDPWSLPPARVHNSEARAGNFNSTPSVTYDFYPYGGIHRPVVLYATNRQRLQALGVTTDFHHPAPNSADVTGVLRLDVTLSEEASGEVRVRVGSHVAAVALDNSRLASLTLEIPSARLWDIGQGNLYTARVELVVGGVVVDSYDQPFGIRTVRVADGKFLLNGREVFFKGFGKHEDFFASGKGLNRPLIVKDFDLLRWVGANSFRTTHYPYAEEMMDFADRHGMLVIDETPFVGMGDRLGTPEILEKARGVVREFVARDRNHPSVVMWSLANEPWLDSEGGVTFLTEVGRLTRELDPTRPITYVAYREPENNPALRHYDVVCINKYYGWYLYPGLIEPSLPELLACMDRFHTAFGKPMILAEFGADAIEGLHTLPGLMFSEEFQSQIIREQYEAVRKLPYCIGAHVWAFADFMANQSVTRVVYNRKGIFTRDRSPKLAAHTLRGLWTTPQ